MEQRMVVESLARPNMDTTVADLTMQTSTIHVAFIFTSVGRKILHTISIGLGATAVEVDGSNWMAFGDHLGVTHEQLLNIQNNPEYFRQTEGPVWWVLATYAQLDEAMVGRVIIALYEIERYDIINRIDDSVRKFARQVSDLRKEFGVNRPGHAWRPVSPPVPLVLQPAHLQENRGYGIANVIMVISDPPVEDIHDRINRDTPFVPVYTVMLTYANDGTNAAQRITRILRSYNPRIGVLLFNEQMSYVFERDLEFVSDCLAQVDTIMPILTQGYYDAISSSPRANETPLGKDQELVLFIFQALGAEYMRNQCTNRRVRCIMPDENTNAPVNPILRVYFPEARIQEYIELLLRNKLGKRGLALARRQTRI